MLVYYALYMLPAVLPTFLSKTIFIVFTWCEALHVKMEY